MGRQSKRPKLGHYATPAQTNRWVKCLRDWAKVNGKTNTQICEMLGFDSRTSWYRIIKGEHKRTRARLIQSTSQQLGLDINFINGVYDFKSKFSEARNIFTEFKDTYTQYMKQGNQYHASQIIRKAAMFLYETLVPKDLMLHLEFENRKNLYESAKITCSPDELNFYKIDIFGGPQCVMFTLSRMAGSCVIPMMEGDLDIHAVSAIKHHISVSKKRQTKTQTVVAKFEDNAKKYAT